MKTFAKRNLPKPLVTFYRNLKSAFRADYLHLAKRVELIEKDLQGFSGFLERERYPSLAMLAPKDDWHRHEFKLYSQNGEDGLLLYLFSLLGTTNCRFVEFGIGDGRENLSANLALNFGWSGLLMDGGEQNVRNAERYYRDLLVGPEVERLTIAREWITKDNINDLLKKHHASGEIDLLSLDIDGNDYWVWQALNEIQPRIVVAEYNASFGDTEAVTVEYDPAFDRFAKHPSGYYHGASLAALEKLGREKGYALVGCDSTGCNAFFIRTDLLGTKLPTRTAKEAYLPHMRRLRKLTTEAQFALIRALPLVRV